MATTGPISPSFPRASPLRRVFASAVRMVGAVLFYCIVTGTPAAQSATLPAYVIERIDVAAREGAAARQRSAALANGMSNPSLAARIAGQADQTAANAMSTVVIGEIARHPALASEIVSAAAAAHPAVSAWVVRDAIAAYPGFANQIAVGARTPSRPATAVARTSTTETWVSDSTYADETADFADADVYEEDDVDVYADTPGDDVNDSLEGFNRAVFGFNDVFDIFIIRPIAAMYGFAMPEVVKESVRNAFQNFTSPVILANDLFQLEGGNALVTTGRMIINTTVGLGGFFDVAQYVGLEHHPADFGQTLHSYGVGAGPYLVLPILGPSTVRDGFGSAIDSALHPLPYFVATEVSLAVGGARGVVKRESVLKPLEDLRESSIDYYAAIRSLYYQDRAVELRQGAPAEEDDLDALFESVE